MNISLNTALEVNGTFHSLIKVGKFEVDTDKMLDVHVLLPPGAKRVLKVWRGDEYVTHQNWSNEDVAARVNELHEAGELSKCFDP